jgi:hypothetical protein
MVACLWHRRKQRSAAYAPGNERADSSRPVAWHPRRTATARSHVVEPELEVQGLGWRTCGSDRRDRGGDAEVREDAGGDVGEGEEREHAEVLATPRAPCHVLAENPAQEGGPIEPARERQGGRRRGESGCGGRRRCRYDARAPAVGRGKYAVEPGGVTPAGWDQGGEPTDPRRAVRDPRGSASRLGPRDDERAGEASRRSS